LTFVLAHRLRLCIIGNLNLERPFNFESGQVQNGGKYAHLCIFSATLRTLWLDEKKLRLGMEWWRSQASVSETKRQRATEHPLLNKLAPCFIEEI